MGDKQSKLASSKKVQTKQEIGEQLMKKSRRAGKKEAVYDEDTRETVESNDSLKFIGLLRTKFKSKDISSIGTGILIQEDIVLTVAHNICFRDVKKFKKFCSSKYQQAIDDIFESNGSSNLDSANLKQTNKSAGGQDKNADFIEYAEWIEFYPGVNGQLNGLKTLQDIKSKRNTEQNCFQVEKYKVHHKYLTETSFRQYDIGLLKLKRKIRIEEKDRIKIVANYEESFQPEISLYGYPKDQCFKQNYQGIEVRQVGTNGRYNLNKKKGFISYTLATAPGQSGSPVFINTVMGGKDQKFCIGIHAGSWDKLRQNYGIYINTQKFKEICEMQQKLTGKFGRLQKAILPSLPSNYKPKPTPKNVNEKSMEQYENQIKSFEESNQKHEIPKMLIYHYKKVAFSYLNKEQYRKSEQFYEKFIKYIEKQIEKDEEGDQNEHDKDEYEIAMINLAKCYSEMNKFDESMALYIKVEKTMQKQSTLTIQKSSTILNNKGAVLVQQQKYQSALQLFKKAYKLRKDKLGAEHIMTVNSLQNIASVNLKLSIDIEQQLKVYQRVLSAKEKRYGVKSKQYISTLINLAITYFQLKRYKLFLQSFFIAIKTQQSSAEIERQNSKTMIDNFCGKLKILQGVECELQVLKLGSQMASSMNRPELSQQLRSQWQKRFALTSS